MDRDWQGDWLLVPWGLVLLVIVVLGGVIALAHKNRNTRP